MTNSDNGWGQRIGYWVGVVLMLALVVVVFLAVMAGIIKLAFQPSANPLALSAVFAPTNAALPGLKIHGQIRPLNIAPTNIWIKVLVETPAGDFRQTALVSVTNDVFELDGTGMVGLRTLDPSELIRIQAEVWDAVRGKRLFSEEIFVNGQKPLISVGMLGAGALAVAVVAVTMFLIAFTGEKTTAKNQLAIKFSYCVIILWLALPMLVPTVLPYLCPVLLEGTARGQAPVGLVVTRVETESSGKTIDAQWALNIGGAVERVNPETAGTLADGTAATSDHVPGEVIVHGGLVIPLWVIILSLIGGAINMTTKVPVYQQKMEDEEDHDGLLWAAKNATRKLAAIPSVLASKMMGFTDKLVTEPPATHADENPGEPAAEAPASAQAAAISAARKARAAKTSQADDDDQIEAKQWRRGLLGEYMSLISAPFLAIVTFYLLRWGDLAHQPVLVIVSFSIGLLSARIIRSITDLAGTFVDQSASRRNGNSGGQKP